MRAQLEAHPRHGIPCPGPIRNARAEMSSASFSIGVAHFH
ncbi:hypothetical protein ADILRU_2093 [Leifsonia rubra CMS 76R]|nr:hypothetical protein ADILRU_2093 [Leifsonia rubra CMS 76R]